MFLIKPDQIRSYDFVYLDPKKPRIVPHLSYNGMETEAIQISIVVVRRRLEMDSYGLPYLR